MVEIEFFCLPVLFMAENPVHPGSKLLRRTNATTYSLGKNFTVRLIQVVCILLRRRLRSKCQSHVRC